MGGFTISRVGHIGVQVTDMDRSIDFTPAPLASP